MAKNNKCIQTLIEEITNDLRAIERFSWEKRFVGASLNSTCSTMPPVKAVSTSVDVLFFNDSYPPLNLKKKCKYQHYVERQYFSLLGIGFFQQGTPKFIFI